MKKKLIILCAMSTMTALFVTGCHSVNTRASSRGRSTAAESSEELPKVWVNPPQTAQATAFEAVGQAQTADQATIELRKEELVVGKREVSNGGVLIRTRVETEDVSKPVELRREEYVVERIPASQAAAYATNAACAFTAQEFYVPLMREEAVAGKRALLTEKVQVTKKVGTEAATVTRPVRTESVDIVKVAGSPPAGPATLVAPAVTGAMTEVRDDNLQLRREELVVGKREVENGGVRLKKVITTQDASQPVELRVEDYSVSRVALGDQPTDQADFVPREIKVDLTREEPVAETRSLLTEVVRIRKQVQTDNQVVSGTVRKEIVEVVKVPSSQTVKSDPAVKSGLVTSTDKSGK